VPDAPTIGAATNVGTSRAFNNGSATVAFTAAATGGTPASYTATSTPGSFTSSGAGSPLTVTGLQSATSYTFAVTGTNTTATGAASASSSSITATTVPATMTAPTATDAGSGRSFVSGGAASVAFTAPATGGSAIIDYTVTSTPGSLTATGGASPLTVTGLTPSTAYTYTVTARNTNGSSTASAASSPATTATTAPAAPTIGTATAGDGTASVTFTAGATGGSAILDYTLTSSSGLTATGASSPIVITETAAGTRTYTVTARNANGTSPASGASNSLVFAAPGAPTIGTVTRTSNTVASVPFTAGSTGNATTTAYTITSSPSISLSYSGTTSPIAVTGTFVQGTSYTFSMTATNKFGTSSASSASNSVTPYPAPTLGAWTLSTAYPFNGLTGSVGLGNTSSLWVGTGYYFDEGNPISTKAGYRWIGSTWSSTNYATDVDGPGVARLNTVNTDHGLFVGGYNRSGYYITQTYSYNTQGGADFTQRSQYPVAAANMGVAALNQSVNVRTTGQNLGVGYYITSLSGSWTSTGVNTPSYGRYSGIDNNFGGEGYYFSGNPSLGYQSYKVTSLTSANTTITSPPWDYSENNVQNTVVNGVMLLFANRSTYKNPYSFNGSTYTAQTVWPATAGDCSGGAFTTTEYRLVNTSQSSQHYVATMS
jgi:hypothetical protein